MGKKHKVDHRCSFRPNEKHFQYPGLSSPLLEFAFGLKDVSWQLCNSRLIDICLKNEILPLLFK